MTKNRPAATRGGPKSQRLQTSGKEEASRGIETHKERAAASERWQGDQEYEMDPPIKSDELSNICIDGGVSA